MKSIHSDGHSFLLFFFKKIISNFFYIPSSIYIPPRSDVDKSPDRERGNCLETENAVSTASMNAETFEYSLRLFIFRLFSQSLRPCYQNKLT